jgi:hypothetical protein
MRLARTAAPLPRKSGRQDSNLRSPVPKTGGVADSPTTRRKPPAGLEPAASGLRARRHLLFDHGGMKLRRQDSNLRLASNSRASCRSTTPECEEPMSDVLGRLRLLASMATANMAARAMNAAICCGLRTHVIHKGRGSVEPRRPAPEQSRRRRTCPLRRPTRRQQDSNLRTATPSAR